MNQTLYELLVPRLSKASDRILQVLLIIIVTILAVGTLFIGPISFIIAAVLGAVSYYFVFPRFQVEYEYTLISHNLDIDIIYNKAKRKKLLTLDLKEAQIIAPAKSHRLDSYQNVKITDYSAQDPNNSPYAVIIPMKQVMNKILIQPDETMQDYMRNTLPRTFFRD